MWWIETYFPFTNPSFELEIYFKVVKYEPEIFLHELKVKTGSLNSTQLPKSNEAKPISPFRLVSLLRKERDPNLALGLFNSPNPPQNGHVTSKPPPPKAKPFRHSMLSYDIILTKLGRARMFDEMERVLLELKSRVDLRPNESLFCCIIDLYARARRPECARKLFDEMTDYRCERTIRSFNSLVNALMSCKKFDEMKRLLVGVERFGVPDACTYNILISGLCKGKRLEDAGKVFDEMLVRRVRPDAVTFGSLIHGLCLDSRVGDALQLKKDMAEVYRVPPDACVYLSLIKGLCRSGELGLAFDLKDEMVKNNLKLGSAVYSTLISGLVKAGMNDKVDGVLEEMELRGCKPDTVTYNVMIRRYCNGKDYRAACKVLDEMAEKGCKPDIITFCSILVELCKDGNWSEAYELFQDMPRRGCSPDVVCYRIVFDGLSESMRFNEAFLVLGEMISKGFRPHSGSVDEFLHFLCYKKNYELLLRTLHSLAKVGALDSKLWRTVVVMVVKDGKSPCTRKLFDNCLC